MRSIIKATVRVIILIMFVMLLKIVISNVQWVIMLPRLNIEQDLLYYTGIIGSLFVIGTLVLYFLWRKTDWLVRTIAGDLNDNELVIKTSNLDLLKVAMRMFGIFLLITSIPELIGLSAYHIRLIHESDLVYSPIQQATTIMNFVSNMITIIIGAWLVIGTRGIAKAIDNLMNAPISNVEK